jgi:hypothetical protein
VEFWKWDQSGSDGIHLSTIDIREFDEMKKLEMFFMEETGLDNCCMVDIRGRRSGYPKISGRVIRVFKISGLRIDTQNYNGFYNTRKFGYSVFRVRVFPNYPNCCVGFIKTHTLY